LDASIPSREILKISVSLYGFGLPRLSGNRYGRPESASAYYIAPAAAISGKFLQIPIASGEEG
jgi:hypothetical protein